jgi:hypothetical protein
MNTNFSSLGFDSNSNVYNSDWRNHPNFSWQAQAMRNCAPQYHDLHHPEYSQFNHQSSYPSSYNYPAQKLSLEDTLKAFIQESKQNIQEVRSVQANFSNTGFDSNSSFYNPDCSNHSDFSWQDQAKGNYAPLNNELHHLEYSQFKNQVLHPSSYDPLPKKLSLEETLQAFIQTSNRNIQELKKVTMSNDQIMQELKQSRQELKNATMSKSQAIKELTHEIRNSTQFTHQAFAKKEEQIDYLVVEFNRMEEEELQSQLMAEGHYKIDEDDANHSCHEKKSFKIEHRDQIEHMEKIEHKEKIEPPTDTSLSNDKEVSTEAHSFIIVPLETQHEFKALILQCLKEPLYAKILKDLCRQAHKSRNHRPKKIFPSKEVGYLRWRNILP